MPDVYGEGTLYRRSDGRYVATVHLRDGRRPSRLCPHRHRPDAQPCREAKANLRALNRLKDDGGIDGARLTLGAYLRRWLVDVRPRLAPATWSKYEQHCRLHLVPALGHHRLSELSVADVRAYLRADHGDPQSIRHRRATLRRALADAVRDGLVGRNVAGLAEPPRLTVKERPILDAGQVRRLIDGTAGHYLPPGVAGPQMPRDRLHALWVLLATTGLREAEALALTWEDVDLEMRDPGMQPTRAPDQRVGRISEGVAVRRPRGGVAGGSGRSVGVADDGSAMEPCVLHVRHTLHRVDGEWQLREPKTAKSRRTVILPAITAEALRDHRRRQQEEWLKAGRPGELGLVFVTPNGRPLHGSGLSVRLRRHLVRLGLPVVTVHDLRHSAATILYGAGVPLEGIADMLGHSTTRVTADLYRHRVEQVQRDVASAMDHAVSG